MIALLLFGSISELKCQDLLYFKDGSIKNGKIFSLLDEEIVWGQMNVNDLPGSSVQTSGFSMLDSIYLEHGKKLHMDMLDPVLRKEKILISVKGVNCRKVNTICTDIISIVPDPVRHIWKCLMRLFFFVVKIHSRLPFVTLRAHTFTGTLIMTRTQFPVMILPDAGK